MAMPSSHLICQVLVLRQSCLREEPVFPIGCDPVRIVFGDVLLTFMIQTMAPHNYVQNSVTWLKHIDESSSVLLSL